MTGVHIGMILGAVVFVISVLALVCTLTKSMTCYRIRDFLLAQLTDGTTWRGITLLATGLGAQVEPAYAESIVIGGLTLAGVLGIIWPPSTK